MPEVILHSVVKYTNKEAYREVNSFDLSMCELESFIALQFVRGITRPLTSWGAGGWIPP